MKPYKCPKCDGRGMLQYDPEFPFAEANTTGGPWACPPCGATGILWGLIDAENQKGLDQPALFNTSVGYI